MKLVTPGPWLSGMMLEMTKGEFEKWLQDYKYAEERVFRQVLKMRIEGKQTMAHYLLINGQPVTVFELETDPVKPAEHKEEVPVLG